MKKIYIAGKIGGLPFDDVVKKFATAQTELEAKGYKVINPVEQLIQYNNLLRISGGVPLTEESNRSEILKMDIQLLTGCNSIYMLKDWHISDGATMEYHIAYTLGMEIMFDSDQTHSVLISVTELHKNDRFSPQID